MPSSGTGAGGFSTESRPASPEFRNSSGGEAAGAVGMALTLAMGLAAGSQDREAYTRLGYPRDPRTN